MGGWQFAISIAVIPKLQISAYINKNIILIIYYTYYIFTNNFNYLLTLKSYSDPRCSEVITSGAI